MVFKKVFKILYAALLILPLLVLSFMAPVVAGANEASRFISVIEDLPLMAELVELADGVQFSTPIGRIAEATAYGKVSLSKVLDFYEKTLPQLGWTRIGTGRFTREGETLELVFEVKGENLNVRFAIAPKNKP